MKVFQRAVSRCQNIKLLESAYGDSLPHTTISLEARFLILIDYLYVYTHGPRLAGNLYLALFGKASTEA